MKHGLIFDLDGTLVNSLAGIASSLNASLALSGLQQHPLEAVRRFIGNGARMLVTRAAGPDTEVSLLDRLEEGFKTDYDVTWPEGTAPYDGIVAMLETLQAEGYPLGVLSNKPHAFTEVIVEKVFPTVDFTAVLGQRAGIPHKPDPAGAFEVARAIGREPSDCLVIGDSTMDLETAWNAGMKAIAVSWGYHDPEALLAANADVMVNTPADLLDAIKAGGRI